MCPEAERAAGSGAAALGMDAARANSDTMLSCRATGGAAAAQLPLAPACAPFACAAEAAKGVGSCCSSAPLHPCTATCVQCEPLKLRQQR